MAKPNPFKIRNKITPPGVLTALFLDSRQKEK